ncbi:MAG TPA: cytochrome c peroxidase [Chitinophagaceae bacterium]|nr:cytochrome c peroxidase [Chitinophagaceae bacterium]
MKRFSVIALILSAIFISSFCLHACNKTDQKRAVTPVAFEIPAGFPSPAFNFSLQPLTREGIALGQQLFYEDRLSAADFACSSCHQQEAAFTTFEHDRSHGYNNSHTRRNAPALSNLAWYPHFRWDGSSTSLDEVAVAHITAPDEMSEQMENVVSKLNSDAKYKQLFRSAFGDETINSQRILSALSQFQLSMVSANSKYDKVKKGSSTFSIYEEMGYTVFKAKCAGCHAEPLFTDFSFRNIGLPADPSLPDKGLMEVTGEKSDSLKFRVPSLRNVAFSSYYMHDGRYPSILRCIEHYRSGIQQSNTLDPALVAGISLSDADVTNLIAFLRTLSDTSYVTNSRYAKP